MMVSLRKMFFVCAAAFAAVMLTACGDSPEDAFEKWRAAVLDGDEETASELVYIDPDGEGIGVKHYNAKVIGNIKSVPAVKERMKSVDVDGEEDAGDNMVILTLTYEEGDEEKEIKQVMRNVDGQWKLDPYASMPHMNLFVKAEEKSAAEENKGSAYGGGESDEKSESTRDTSITGGNTNFEENSEGVQIDFENE